MAVITPITFFGRFSSANMTKRITRFGESNCKASEVSISRAEETFEKKQPIGFGPLGLASKPNESHTSSPTRTMCWCRKSDINWRGNTLIIWNINPNGKRMPKLECGNWNKVKWIVRNADGNRKLLSIFWRNGSHLKQEMKCRRTDWRTIIPMCRSVSRTMKRWFQSGGENVLTFHWKVPIMSQNAMLNVRRFERSVFEHQLPHHMNKKILDTVFVTLKSVSQFCINWIEHS